MHLWRKVGLTIFTVVPAVAVACLRDHEMCGTFQSDELHDDPGKECEWFKWGSERRLGDPLSGFVVSSRLCEYYWMMGE